ncbi:DUF397 domain-containing protein [Streptomyces laurentii]|uniref:DUF397 domain-containing protein n=1 Tax=Streptomyces laurentii TaxID=39478 RepID=UPI00368F3958
MIPADDLSVVWFSSSHSNDQGGRCSNGDMAVRDSKDPHGPGFRFSPAAWAGFVDHVKTTY